MSLLFPTFMFSKVTDISIKLLKEMSIDLILLDVDNTLAAHGSQEPFEGVLDWIYDLKKSGFSVVIVSNNFKSRVYPFANKLQLPFISFALKPTPLGFNRAKKLIGINSKNVLVVGDQVFTDILGANLAGMKSILLEPIIQDEAINIKFKRKLEIPIRKRFSKFNDIKDGDNI